MDARKLMIAPKCLGDNLMLTSVSPYKKYVDGKATDEVEGYRYTVACPALDLEKIGVKIKGKQQMQNPEGSFPIVRFTDLEIKPYVMNGSLGVTATATAITEVNTTK